MTVNSHELRPRTPRFVQAVIVAGLAAFVAVGALVFKFGLDREPYRMILKSVDGRSYVQFVRIDENLVSPEFPINLPVTGEQELVLRSPDVVIPGCAIEFCDTTLLPGRFRIRVGDAVYDVMERSIDVKGRSNPWELR